jgi:hypothetical protein
MVICPFLIKEDKQNQTVATYGLKDIKDGVSHVDEDYCSSFGLGTGCKYFKNKRCWINEK